VQGLTEFLPVSSSGHLVLFQRLLGTPGNNLVFDVAVHLGTVMSILTIYHKLFFTFCKSSVQGIKENKMNQSLKLAWLIIIASIPTGIIGLGLKDLFERLFENTTWVGIFFCVTGLVLFLTKNRSKDGNFSGKVTLDVVDKIKPKQALAMGIVQGLSIAPGISRSGSTISTGIFVGIERNSAAMFSFVMSVPAILGAALLEIRKLNSLNPDMYIVLTAGLVTAYVFGLLGLWLILKVVSKGRLEIFSYYLWLLGPSLILWL